MNGSHPQTRRPEARGRPTADEVKAFWETHPSTAESFTAEPGTRAFYDQFDAWRTLREPPASAQPYYRAEEFAGLRVLDAGCGNGYVVQWFADRGAVAVGVDIARRSVDLTRGRFAVRGRAVPALAEASAEALPFPDDCFHAVTSMGVVHHTPDDAGAIRELIRVLRPGGRLMLMVYHRNSALYRLTFPLTRLLSRTFRGWDTARLVNLIDGPENPLGRVYSRRELAWLLPGCDVVEMTAGCLRDTLPAPRGLPDPAALMPAAVERALARRFGICLYVAAIKRPSPVGPHPGSAGACRALAGGRAAIKRPAPVVSHLARRDGIAAPGHAAQSSEPEAAGSDQCAAGSL